MIKKASLILLIILMCSTHTYAYSSGFVYMLNAMNIDVINVNGLSVNEEIYEKYNLIVYGSPANVSHNQRFKETTTGNWSSNGELWNGKGSRGEWWILGEDYSGLPVHNEIFPDDYTTGTSPLNWNYRVVKNAEESWYDTSKFQYDIQKEYMLNSKLSRFGVTYDLTAAQIGMDKARVENYATWGNAGSIYTEKPGEGNVYWAATFSIPPIAKDAELVSVINLEHGYEYTISEKQDFIEIPINFGAIIKKSSEYARKEHIKIIESELKIDSINVDVVSESKTKEIEKDYILVVNKENYDGKKQVVIELECNSIMATFFSNDPAMYATATATIVVNFESKEIDKVKYENEKNAPEIYKIEIKRVTNVNGVEKLTDLYVSRKTGTSFVCAGQVIKIRVTVESTAEVVSFDFSGYTSIKTLDDLTKRFEWDEPRERGESTRYSSLRALQNSYTFPKAMKLVKVGKSSKVFEATYVIPYETTQTLHSWNSLREISGNAFNIDESKLFSRKDRSYSLVIKASSARKTGTESMSFDVAERWDELYNRDISKYIK